MFVPAILSVALAVLLNAAGPTHHSAISGKVTTDLTKAPTTPQRYGVLAGKVTGSEGNPINGAAVEIQGTAPRLGGYARPDGSYRIPRLAPGRYTVIARLEPSFKESTFTVNITAGATTTLDISLKPEETTIRREHAVTRTMKSKAMKMDFAAGDSKMAEGMVMSAPEGKGAASGEASRDRVSTSARKSIGSDDVGEISSDTAASRRPVQRAGQLTAGEWSDLMHWAYWGDVSTSSEWKGMVSRWGFDPSSRIVVRVADRTQPVMDAQVRLVDAGGKVLWTARTDNRGTAELFAGVAGSAENTRVQVRRGSEFVDAGAATPGAGTPVMVSLPGGAAQRNEFDMAFMIDATGSMGDEMEYLKAELENVIERIRETSNDDLSIRLSCNVYRDRGDEYVVRTFPFSESTFDMIGHLRKQYAGGGGDFEEAVEEGLEAAIEKLEWRPAARARLLFLVLDAPPHYTPDRVAKLQELAGKAAARGIRIIPLAASGINKETEFLLRPLAIYTGGTYLFLTDDSGIGNSHMKPSIGQYTVEYLNDLMVKVIARYLATDVLSAENGNGIDLR